MRSTTPHLSDTIRLLAISGHLCTRLIESLPPGLMSRTDGPGRWTIHEVLAHLVDLETSERGWLPRITHILDGSPGHLRRVEAARHLPAVSASPAPELLLRFSRARQANLATLRRMPSDPDCWARVGRHPDLGPLTAANLLVAWAMHDLDHLAQVVTIVGVHHAAAIGPIAAYVRICRPREASA